MYQLLKWKWELTAPLMGALLTLSFAPYDFAYAALPALMFLYKAWSTQTLMRAALTAYLFGLGLFGSGIWWVYVSIHDFGGADAFSAAALTLLLVCVWAMFPALTGALAVRILRSPIVWLRILAVALLWAAVEYLRGYWLLNGFPWLQIAYSQLRTPLAGYSPLVGVYGVGFLLAASAFALVEMLNRRPMWGEGMLFLLVIWGAGGWLKTVQWTEPVGEPIKITLVQGNISQEQKWQRSQMPKTLRLYQQLTEQHWDSDVIIWPETSIPAFLSQVKESFLDPLAASARRHDVDLVVSLPTEGQGKAYYNTVMTLGESQAQYHKNHLLPFGEYLPLQPLSGWVLELMEIPLGNFAAGGDRQTLLRAGGYPFVTTICYEDVFGELVTRQIAEAAYIVNVTNDAWFGNSSQPHQHMQMAQMRALETGRFLVRVTNTGATGFIAPNGSISSQAPLFTTTTLTDTIVPMAGMTPYARTGDNMVFAGLGLLVMVIHALGSLRRRSRPCRVLDQVAGL